MLQRRRAVWIGEPMVTLALAEYWRGASSRGILHSISSSFVADENNSDQTNGGTMADNGVYVGAERHHCQGRLGLKGALQGRALLLLLLFSVARLLAPYRAIASGSYYRLHV